MLASLFSAVLTSSVQGQWCLCFCSIFSRESGSLAFIKILPNSSTHFTHLHYILVQSLNWIWLLWPHGVQQARILSTPLFPGICSNLCPLSWWCYLTVLSFVVPFSSCLQCFPALGSFPMSLCFVSGGQRIGASASASVLPEDIQGWFPLRLTGVISLQTKEFSRVFSSYTIQKHYILLICFLFCLD